MKIIVSSEGSWAQKDEWRPWHSHVQFERADFTDVREEWWVITRG